MSREPQDSSQRQWRERLGTLVVSCPRCRQAWLTLGAQQGEPHRCKACGCSFVVGDVVADRQEKRG